MSTRPANRLRHVRAALRRLARSPVVVWGERVLVLVLLLFIANRLAPQIGAWTGIGPAAGRGTAPEIRVATLAGERIGPEDLAGRVVVLNFWATWCGPCRVEMPWLQKLHERYAEQGLVVLGLATDAAGRAPVERFLAERGITYPVAMADDAIVRDFGGIRGIPTTFIIDRAGVIRHRVVGIFAQPAMDAAVRRLLAEPAPADRPVVAL